MPEFLDFGKHTAYVWSAFGITLVVLVANVAAAHRRLNDKVRRARRRLAAEDAP